MQTTSTWTEIVLNLTGGMSLGTLISAFFFVCLGAVLNVWLDVNNRDEGSANTPEVFVWSFFWRKNYIRLIFDALTAYVVVRFFSDVFLGTKFSMLWAFGVGLVFDWLIVALREIRYILLTKLRASLRRLKDPN